MSVILIRDFLHYTAQLLQNYFHFEKNVHETLMVDGNGKDIEQVTLFTIPTIYLHQLHMCTEIGLKMMQVYLFFLLLSKSCIILAGLCKYLFL